MINRSLIQEPLTMFATPWSGSNKVNQRTNKLEIWKRGICLRNGSRTSEVMFLKLYVFQTVYLFQILR